MKAGEIKAARDPSSRYLARCCRPVSGEWRAPATSQCPISTGNDSKATRILRAGLLGRVERDATRSLGLSLASSCPTLAGLLFACAAVLALASRTLCPAPWPRRIALLASYAFTCILSLQKIYNVTLCGRYYFIKNQYEKCNF